MFIETHQDRGKLLTFIKSGSIQAFPCGRRHSKVTEYDVNGDGNIAENESLVFPFDPEARLNTEANNRRHSSINGFTQTYLKSWDAVNKLLTLSLAGYLFTINLADDCVLANNFGNSIINTLGEDAEDANRLYANILVEEIPLFEGFKNYHTSILRNQSNSSSTQEEGIPTTSLDLPKTGATVTELEDFENYYFSGLSFSATPITDNVTDTYSIVPASFTRNSATVNQQLVSLCILEKVSGSWKIYEPAYLPAIRHGISANSVVLGDTLVDNTVDAEGNIIPGNLTVKNKVTVHNELEVNGKATINQKAEEPYGLIVEGNVNITDILETSTVKAETIGTTESPITELTATSIKAVNIGDDTNKVTNIVSTAANIETATVDTLTANTALYQKNNDKVMQVPIIELKSDGEFWQLQISGIGEKSAT